MNKDIDVYKWHDVTTQEDIDELLDISAELTKQQEF